MRAWRVQLVTLPAREPAPAGAIIRMQAAPVLSYMRQVIDGSLGYILPPFPFTPGTNGIGIVEAVGPGVRHIRPGQRVLLDPHLVADERAANPAQILIGLTATASSEFGDTADAARALQTDWPDGTFTELAHMPVSVLTPMPTALDAVPAARMRGLDLTAIIMEPSA